MITATESIVSLLKNPSTETVNLLFCEVSIRKALDVSCPEEWAIATDRKDQDWIDARNAEYEDRRLKLLAHIEHDKISRETAKKVDAWAIANPYIRPVNASLVAQAKLELELEYAIAQRSAAFADRDRFHDANRFGWDYVANAEDSEYSAMLKEMDMAQRHEADLREHLKLAIAGFVR